MRSRRSIHLPIVLGLIGIAVAILLSGFMRPCRIGSCIGFIGQGDWRTKDVYEDSAKTWRGTIGSGDEIMRMEIVNDVTPADAHEFTAIALTKLAGLYEPARSPYPGAFSQVIRCDTRYIPKPERIANDAGLDMTYYRGFVNARLNYGSCSDSQMVYAAHASVFYCPNERTWVHMEYFIPSGADRPEDYYPAFFKGVTCGKTPLFHR